MTQPVIVVASGPCRRTMGAALKDRPPAIAGISDFRPKPQSADVAWSAFGTGGDAAKPGVTVLMLTKAT